MHGTHARLRECEPFAATTDMPGKDNQLHFRLGEFNAESMRMRMQCCRIDLSTLVRGILKCDNAPMLQIQMHS